ncbi:MAG: hypothetical protein AAB967_04120, partial [Patescibacteria group bacterium]
MPVVSPTQLALIGTFLCRIRDSGALPDSARSCAPAEEREKCGRTDRDSQGLEEPSKAKVLVHGAHYLVAP